ncbi:MAG: permease-like cell division protein FtsX [bacterium]|nr:permease-like cell division protein FtsX [bacterium]
MITTLFRLVKYGLQSFARNTLLSIGTVAVVTLVLSVLLGMNIFSVLANNSLTILRDKIDISVYFNTDVQEDEILEIQRALESLKEVKQVDYVSRDKALEIFKERHQEDDTITQAITVLDENPLSASLNIKAHDPRDYPLITAYLDNENLGELVDQVTYSQNEVVINRLASILETAQRVGMMIVAALSIIAIFVTLNTIMLAIYSTRDEIGIMRLVGASNKFIRGPYIIQGALYGIIAAVLSLLIAIPIIYFAAPYVKVLMPDMDLNVYFFTNILTLFGYQILFGVALGTISSYIAVRRYLKI